MKIVPVLMAGGSGTRLWPLSRPEKPKQFLNLDGGEHSLFQQALARAAHPDFEQPIIIGNYDHRFLIAEQCREMGIEPMDIILEEESTGTACTVALGALRAQEYDSDVLVLVLSCDQKIEINQIFWDTVFDAANVAQNGKLIVFGIEAKSAHTGYGYIQKGEDITEAISEVKSFKEKPDKNTAKQYINDGSYYWNSGIFLFSAKTILKEIEYFNESSYSETQGKYKKINKNNDFSIFSKVEYEPNSIDRAVIEKSKNCAMIELKTGWSDLGSWRSLLEELSNDKDGNLISGHVENLRTRNAVLYADGTHTLAVLGLENIAVVVEGDTVLVTHLDEAENVPHLMEALKEECDDVD